jgi:hypothetical protein
MALTPVDDLTVIVTCNRVLRSNFYRRALGAVRKRRSVPAALLFVR